MINQIGAPIEPPPDAQIGPVLPQVKAGIFDYLTRAGWGNLPWWVWMLGAYAVLGKRRR